FLVELLRHFGLQAALEFERDGENLLFSITGEGVSALIGRHGQTLDAIQYLANAAVNKGDDDWVRVVVDVDGYRKRREQIVTQMAHRVVGEVRRRHMALKMEPMNAAERRLVHMVVQQFADVQSESEGDEPYRRVIIRPAR
ncbi:MAG TPA: R3H domain-containing nucleic acid-binding protein, partial [Limnochordia bacterium]|nr:R3H domain-containing nucleic acid-binding protein [Limnochordia bacterium]